MNAHTRLRLWKETRALLPMWAAIAGLMGLSLLIERFDALAFSWSVYAFGCVLLGSFVVGQEFQHRTMGLLLSQPVPRRRIWGEKLLVLGAALVGLCLWLTVLGYFRWSATNTKFGSSDDALAATAVWILPLLLGFCTGPGLTSLARGTIGGVALTFMCPFGVFILCLWFLPDGLDSPRRWVLNVIVFIAAFGIYAGLMLLWGCRRFQCLEDRHGHGQELSLPAVLTKPFAEFTGRFTLGHGSALGHLVRKEVRLHLPAFVVAAGLVVLWLALVTAMFISPTLNKGFLMLPVVLLGLGIPVIAGIVSTAEERSLGLLDWHLTLPVSARRQWFIKVLVALAVNVVLGILLPGVLALGTQAIAQDALAPNYLVRDCGGFAIANTVIFCAALYASTAASNSTRALVGTIVLFLAGAMVMNLAIMTVDWLPESFYPMPDRYGWWPAPELCQWAFEAITPLGWGFLVWFGALGLTNFRRSMEVGWRPVRRLVPFVTTIWLVLTFVFTYLREFSHYEWTYYEMNKSLRWDSQKRAKQRAVERGKLEVVPTIPVPNASPAKPRD